MKDYNVEGRLITKEDWEEWLNKKCQKETDEEKVEWHPYPKEKPKKFDKYLVKVHKGWNLFTYRACWIPERNAFWEFSLNIIAWAEIPEPYEE